MQKLEGEKLIDTLTDYFKLDFNMSDEEAEQTADEITLIMKDHLDEIKTW